MGSGAAAGRMEVSLRKHDGPDERRNLSESDAMRRFRFHLGTLVLVVLVIGTGLAALHESNEIWDSVVFTLVLTVLLVSVLLAVHRTETRRAFWLGFALFGVAYLGLSLVPPFESRLITTKALAYIDSQLPRSIKARLTYLDYDNDGAMDLDFVNPAQSNALDLNKGNGTFQDVTATVGSNPANQATVSGTFYLSNTGRLLVRGSVGTTENFMRIGHSLLALVAAFVGGQLSRHLYEENRQTAHGQDSPQISTSSVGSAD
jgi:hypothetical protein